MWVATEMSNDFLERHPYPKPFEWHPMNRTFTDKVECLDCGKMTKPYKGRHLCSKCRTIREAEIKHLIKKKKIEKS